MVPPGSARVTPARSVRSQVRVPGDKTIAHRHALLASLADGRSVICGFAPGADCQSTLACLEALGIQLSRSGGAITDIGRGPGGFRSRQTPLNAGNPGTTARLLAGFLAGRPSDSAAPATHRGEVTVTGAGAGSISYPGSIEVLGSPAA